MAAMSNEVSRGTYEAPHPSVWDLRKYVNSGIAAINTCAILHARNTSTIQPMSKFGACCTGFEPSLWGQHGTR